MPTRHGAHAPYGGNAWKDITRLVLDATVAPEEGRAPEADRLLSRWRSTTRVASLISWTSSTARLTLVRGNKPPHRTSQCTRAGIGLLEPRPLPAGVPVISTCALRSLPRPSVFLPFLGVLSRNPLPSPGMTVNCSGTRITAASHQEDGRRGNQPTMPIRGPFGGPR